MRGHLVTQCCACGLPKGDRDSNTGWWQLVERGDSRRHERARDYCPECAPRLLVRSDEVQTDPRSMYGLRIVTVRDLRAILSTLRTATTDSIDPRSTIGWRVAEKMAQSVGFEGLPKATQLREFGFIPREIP